jgi:hypothetical protein
LKNIKKTGKVVVAKSNVEVEVRPYSNALIGTGTRRLLQTTGAVSTPTGMEAVVTITSDTQALMDLTTTSIFFSGMIDQYPTWSVLQVIYFNLKCITCFILRN